MLPSSFILNQRPGGAARLWNSVDCDRLSLAWLGQAGFAFRSPSLRILIDPYLSDYLERKYRGTDKPHDRLMAAPLSAGSLGAVDFVFCSHRHSDHMDPDTLRLVSERSPACRFVIPRAAGAHALSLGLDPRRLLGLDAGESLVLSPELSVAAVAAAHETLETNERGEHHFLGYILHFDAATIYHSGDTIPYPGLAGSLLGQKIDLALLPVNGRGKGVPGNFTFEEAVALCEKAGIPYLIPHHFGMFCFNTVDREILAAKASLLNYPRINLPDLATEWLPERPAVFPSPPLR